MKSLNFELATREELIREFREQRDIIKEKEKKIQELELMICPRVGNLGQWQWDLVTNAFICNEQKLRVLGYDMPEKLTYQFFADKYHWDDFQRVMDAMNKHLNGVLPVYEIEYRIRAKNGRWKWLYEHGKVIRRASDGSPILVAGNVFDITNIKLMEIELDLKKEQLSELITTDELTKVYNRKALFEKLEQDMLRSKRYKLDLSVLMLDIDDFNTINDEHGHLVGDDALTQMATLLKMSTRNVDYIGRYGGDEFMLVLPNCALEDAKIVANRIGQNIEKYFYAVGLKITVSGGLKEYLDSISTNDISLNDFISGIEKLLHNAKRAGKNKIIY